MVEYQNMIYPYNGIFFSPKMDTFLLLQSGEPWKYMLSERNQLQKVTYCVIPFLWNVQNRKIKPDNPKGIHPYIFIGRTEAVAEAPVLWPPNGKSRLIGKDPDAGKD